MKIKIIQPYIPAQAVFVYRIPERARFSTQLGPLVVAALTPDEFELEVINEQVEEIDFEDPVDIVGISTLTANAVRSYEIADRFRAKGCTVIMGGIHASFLPEEALQHCDSVVIGEAEYSWTKLLNDWKNKKLKKTYSAGKAINMADVPIPRRDLDLTVGFVEKIEASRGCPYNCDFCSTNLHFGCKHRLRPVSRILKDINGIYKYKNGWFLSFTDDNIIGNPKFARELFVAMKNLNVSWSSQCSIQIADDKELLKLAGESGCRSLSIGFESLSAANLNDMGKRQNKVRNYEDQIKRIKDAGICSILANFVFGFDHDDKGVFEKTTEFVIKNEINAYFTILTPYPRTKLREKLMAEGRVLHSDWSLYDTSHCVIQPKLMEPEELEEGYLWAYQQIHPNQKVMAYDSEKLHNNNVLSCFSKHLISIKRKKEEYHG